MSIKTKWIAFLQRSGRFLLHGVPVINVTASIVQLAPNHLLDGRVALVTGGTSGIGKEIARAFIEAGARVIITGRTFTKVQKSCEEINVQVSRKGYVWGIEMNMRDTASLADKFNDALSLVGGKIDILVNNAGIQGGVFGSEQEDTFSAVMETNLKGVYFLSQIVAHYMKNNNIEGNILNIASSSSLRPAATSYTLSKWGIRGLTLGMAKSLVPYGIIVNGLAPGPTVTPMLMKDESSVNIYRAESPIGRYAVTTEMANMAVVLVSNMGRMVVGDIIYMTGGAGLTTFDDIYYGFE